MEELLSSKFGDSDSDSFDGEDALLLQTHTAIPKSWHHKRVKLAAYILVICLWSIASFSVGYLVCHFANSWNEVGTYEHGFKSDMSLPIHVPLQEVLFTGSPHFFKNGTSWRSEADRNAQWPENEKYFGTPSHEIDASWTKLLMPQNISLSEYEAKAAWGDRYMEYYAEGWGFTAVLDVFHALHCVDFIRRAFHQDWYPFTHLHGAVHLEHCLDNIRQSIQCYGSTTLIPAKFFGGLGFSYIDADQVHTCRDIRVLREWVNERQLGGKYYHQRY